MIWPRISWARTPKAKRKVGVLLGLLFVVMLLVSSNWFWRLIYPIYHEDVIRQAAQKNHVDPTLVVALIRTESKFKEEDISHVGAVGLMQLMPDTATWIAKQSGISYKGTTDLADPTTNIQLGTWYLGYLSKQYKGNWVAVVAAYNAGPNRVNRWLSDKTWDGQLETNDHIPVGETRHYVQRVYFYYDKYKKLYPDF
ncbi:MAG: lytic transglycosylase domain-containing protein [Tumebacillaceae bacterium]